MRRIANQSVRFLRSEDGPTAVEYAVMLALIIVVCMATIRSVGTSTNAPFRRTANSLRVEPRFLDKAPARAASRDRRTGQAQLHVRQPPRAENPPAVNWHRVGVERTSARAYP